jgi:3-deoxy-D-manno-octulosonic-acid transferase
LPTAYTPIHKEKLDTNAEKSKDINMYILYNTVLLLAAIIVLPYYLLKIIFTGKYRKSLIPKLGGRQAKILANLKDGPRVWIHAVSVGEVTAAAPIAASLKAKRPDVEIIFSTSTETGQEMARRLIQDAAAFIYFPLDIPQIVRKSIKQVNPNAFVMMETELWPNFLKACKSKKIKTLMVNGRFSLRSYGKYRLTSFFWKKILNDLSAAGMITKIDAARFTNIGMPEDKIQVMGNAKYDALAAMASPALQKEIARRFNVRADERFFVAGSTHPGEEEVIIDVYKKLLEHHPEFKTVIVPRHIERTGAILELLRKSGLPDAITLTDMNKGKIRKSERIIVVDVIGELFKIYSLATIVYCGGSLVPKGGQNILEAAAWGKVIFYGPSMDDFSEEKALLEEAGCGVTIRSAAELLQNIIHALEYPEELDKRGARGKAVVAANMGAAVRYADLISKHI